MKIVRLDNTSYSDFQVRLIADSACHLDRKPIFPQAGEWRCELRTAIRIDRLGKTISQRFANRYYNNFAIVNLLLPNDERVNDQYFAMIDDVMVQGPWNEIPQDGSIGIKIGETPHTLLFDKQAIDRILCKLSECATFKTGDIIILPEVIQQYTPAENMHIIVTSGQQRLIDFNIK